MSASLRKVGALLILAAVATLVAVAGRLAADADQPTLAESLNAIAESRLEYSLGWFARIVSGGALAAAACVLWKRMSGTEGGALKLVVVMFAVSGVCTMLSGASSALLTAMAPAADQLATDPSATAEAFDVLRWVFGKAGFTASGLALLAASHPLLQGGGLMRLAALLTALLGVAMLFIWWDAATTLHRTSGPAFVVWLIVAGALLLAGKGSGALAGEPESS